MSLSLCESTTKSATLDSDQKLDSPADTALEQELRELAEEYAPKTARERGLVATILLAERELRKLDKVSRLSATPCDSAAFTRSFNSARNAKDQANKAFDRLRAAADLTHAAEPTAKSRKKKAEPEPAPKPVAYKAKYPNEPRIRDTPYQVGDITSMLEDGWPEADILQACPSLTAEDVKFCREQLETKGPWHAHPQYDPRPAEAASTRVLLIGLVLGLMLLARGMMSLSWPTRALAPFASVVDVVPKAGEAAADLEMAPSVGSDEGGLQSRGDSPILGQLTGEENTVTLQQQGRGRGARKSDGDHQREEVGDHHLVRPGYPRHGLAGGADRPPDGPDQGSGRSLQDA
jgi:hypothetical protein